jgi:glycosyltransferase involved in cell wall biosynthesis
MLASGYSQAKTFGPRHRIEFYLRVRAAMRTLPRPDLIDLHGGLGDLVIGSLILPRRAPLVATNHMGFTLDGPKGRLLVRSPGRRLRGIICASREMADAMVAAGIPDRYIRAIPAGIDDSFYALAPLRERTTEHSGPFRVLCVGRVTKFKGQHVLIEASRLLHHAGFDHIVDVVGDGDLLPPLSAAAAGLPVTFHGALPLGDYQKLLASADVVVVPSVVVPEAAYLRETSPIVIGEAMAAGVPVIATRTGGIPELIDDGVDGLLVEADSPSALEAAVLRLHGNPDLAGRLAEAARIRAAARNWSRITIETEAAVQSFVLDNP